MENVYHATGNRADFKAWNITRYRKGYIVMIKESIHQEKKKSKFVCTKNIDLQYIRQKKKKRETSFKGKIYKTTIIVGGIHIFFSVTDGKCHKKSLRKWKI